MSGEAETTYRGEAVRDALVRDPGIGQLDVQIRISGSRAFVSGTTPTRERRDLITERVQAMLPGMEVMNHMLVIDQRGTPDEERVQ
jgi:hypothetical protein